MARKINAPRILVWHLNLAFLLAYKGDLKGAVRHYRSGSKLPPAEDDTEVISQVESFMVWVLDQEPHKVQLHYALGFFNWKIKGDPVQARKDFETFLAKTTEGVFQKERELTEEWLHQLGATVSMDEDELEGALSA